MPRARTAGSHLGACGSYTELGPPESTMPVGSSLRISSSVVVHGRTEEKTCCSRMRRAMSCVYWPPKSRTTTPPRSEFGRSCWCCCIWAPLDIVPLFSSINGDRNCLSRVPGSAPGCASAEKAAARPPHSKSGSQGAAWLRDYEVHELVRNHDLFHHPLPVNVLGHGWYGERLGNEVSFAHACRNR